MDLTTSLKSEFEVNQESTCSVILRKSDSSYAKFNIYCENKNKASSFSVEVNNGILLGSGTSWLKGTHLQATCEIEWSVSENIIRGLDINCLHTILP